MKITIQNKSMESAPIVIDIPNKKMSKEATLQIFDIESWDKNTSEEAFPHVGTLLFKGHVGVKDMHSISDVINLPKLKEAVSKIPEYVSKKGWVVVDQKEADDLPRTFWTKLGGASDSQRDQAKTETWKTVSGVPLCILEKEYDTTYYIDNGNGIAIPVTVHNHDFEIYCFLRKESSNKIFTRCVARLKVKDRKKSRND